MKQQKVKIYYYQGKTIHKLSKNPIAETIVALYWSRILDSIKESKRAAELLFPEQVFNDLCLAVKKDPSRTTRVNFYLNHGSTLLFSVEHEKMDELENKLADITIQENTQDVKTTQNVK